MCYSFLSILFHPLSPSFPFLLSSFYILFLLPSSWNSFCSKFVQKGETSCVKERFQSLLRICCWFWGVNQLTNQLTHFPTFSKFVSFFLHSNHSTHSLHSHKQSRFECFSDKLSFLVSFSILSLSSSLPSLSSSSKTTAFPFSKFQLLLSSSFVCPFILIPFSASPFSLPPSLYFLSKQTSNIFNSVRKSRNWGGEWEELSKKEKGKELFIW